MEITAPKNCGWPQFPLLTMVIALLSGCASADVIERIANREESRQGTTDFILTADENAYTISRWWGEDHEAFELPRNDLPEGCKTARFFLNDSSRELRIAEPVVADWREGVQPPRPDGSYPPCALLVSYGVFSGPPALEGVAVTSSAGLIAKDERIRPHPAAWALYPLAGMAEGYAIVGAIWTSPVWLPIALMSEGREERLEREKKTLPPAVAACWSAIDAEMKKPAQLSVLDIKFAGFEWSPAGENTYDITATDEFLGEDNKDHIDARVTLRKGRAVFRSIWTGADVECGLHSGNVVVLKVNPLR